MDLISATWRKSSYSATQSACVEVAFGGVEAAIRDSKDPAGGALVLGRAAVTALVVEAGAQRGDLLGQ
ncbi:DUF397 domain-containing protein [Amycolatopsis sp. NPDC059021]|uniref:DUF397 domain-containing protein n=1 Tax=Amycolatopsis sp. NPDC059021 TaxID=3346704 RepID=UPI00366FC543